MENEKLQKENEQLKKEIEYLKSNIYKISIYSKMVEGYLAKIKNSLRSILAWARLDWNE